MDQESKQTVRVERIIALKRYEQPPPGYFHLLPDRIINRIEYGEGRSSFWEKWCPAFRVRPVLAYALGLTVCGALTAGIYCAPKMDQTADRGESPSEARWAVASASTQTGETRLGGSRWLGSTNPVTAPRTSETLFLPTEARAMPVSLYLGN
jgi:hypothetical protein